MPFSNQELIEARACREALDLERTEAQAQIAALQAKLRGLDDLVMAADWVTDVIDGVCLRISRVSDGRWCEARTVADGEPKRTLTAILYEVHGTPGCWAIRINEIGAKNACVHNRERWFGGRVIGLGERLSYEDARRVAEAWVVRGQEPSSGAVAANAA